jgi:hypothetical protein
MRECQFTELFREIATKIPNGFLRIYFYPRNSATKLVAQCWLLILTYPARMSLNYSLRERESERERTRESEMGERKRQYNIARHSKTPSLN